MYLPRSSSITVTRWFEKGILALLLQEASVHEKKECVCDRHGGSVNCVLAKREMMLSKKKSYYLEQNTLLSLLSGRHRTSRGSII